MGARAPSTSGPELLDHALERVVQVRREAIAALLWSCAYFFCLLAAYYSIRPVRDEMAVQFGAARLQYRFTAVLATMIALVPLFGALAARLPVKRLLPMACALLAACYAPFAAGVDRAPIAPVFLVWVSVFNLFVVSVFWSFMTDLFATEAAPVRLHLRGRAPRRDRGRGLTTALVKMVGVDSLLLASAVLLRIAGGTRFLRSGEEVAGERPTFWVGVIRIARSRDLIGIWIYPVCYTVLARCCIFSRCRSCRGPLLRPRRAPSYTLQWTLP